MATIAPPSEFPPISYDPQSTEAMPDDIKAAVEAYLAIVRAYQYPHPIFVTKIEVSSWLDPENGSRHWTVTHWLDAPDDQAMDYWEAVDTEIEQKLGTLAPKRQILSCMKLRRMRGGRSRECPPNAFSI